LEKRDFSCSEGCGRGKENKDATGHDRFLGKLPEDHWEEVVPLEVHDQAVDRVVCKGVTGETLAMGGIDVYEVVSQRALGRGEENRINRRGKKQRDAEDQREPREGNQVLPKNIIH